MKMLDYLDQDRERVLAGLRGAVTPAEAQQVVEKETDRLLLQYNEDCENARVRDAASGMMQALRSSAPLLDSTGDVRVWKQEGGSGGYGSGTGYAGSPGHGKTGRGAGRGHSLSRILLIAGAVLILAAFAVPALSAGGGAAAGTLLKGILLPIAGGACMYFAGRTSASNTRIGIGQGGAAGNPGGGDRIEILIDPEKLWNSLRGAVMVIDRNLELAQEEETYARRKENASPGGKALSAEEIDLFSGLLEMADADSPQMSADIRYYLHKKGVEALDWSPSFAAWFETLPALPGSGGESSGTKTVTIRPALVQDGKLLKKGLAAGT